MLSVECGGDSRHSPQLLNLVLKNLAGVAACSSAAARHQPSSLVMVVWGPELSTHWTLPLSGHTAAPVHSGTFHQDKWTSGNDKIFSFNSTSLLDWKLVGQTKKEGDSPVLPYLNIRVPANHVILQCPPAFPWCSVDQCSCAP